METTNIMMEAARQSTYDRYLFHLTSEDKLESIMEEGLIPQLGSNSRQIGDDRKGTFLCEYKDVKYWRLLLNRDCLIRVDKEFLRGNYESFRYSLYEEILTSVAIPPEYLKVVETPSVSQDVAIKLALSCMDSLSYDCVMAARFYEGYYNLSELNISEEIECTLASLKNINFGVIPAETKAKHLTDEGESGGYTMMDYYKNTDSKLYEQLLLYKRDEHFKARRHLHEFIIKNFYDVLDVNTGGWTG